MRANSHSPSEAVERPEGRPALGSPDRVFRAAQRGDRAAQERMQLNRDVLEFFGNGGSAADPSTQEALYLSLRCAQVRELGAGERSSLPGSLVSTMARLFRKLAPSAMGRAD